MPTDESANLSDLMPPGPFLGRRAELARLCDAVEEVRLEQGSRLWIVGPAGIGKSRLLAEVARYAAWRGIPVGHIRSSRDRDAPGDGPSLQIVDPVAAGHVARLEERLCRAAEQGRLGLATATSSGLCAAANIPKAALIEIDELDPEDALRLLGAWVGSALDLDWARSVVHSTGGHPERMRRAAERFLSTRRRKRAWRPPPTSGAL